jgi:hypothetical protein
MVEQAKKRGEPPQDVRQFNKDFNLVAPQVD